MTVERPVCGSCPFRVSNHGKRIPKGWYSRANLVRLWRGVSEGERLVCTELQATPDGAAKLECTGALYLVLRHLEAAKRGEERRAAIPLSDTGLARWRGRLVPTPVGAPDEAFSPPLYPSSGEALGVPWRCSVTNAPDDPEDEAESKTEEFSG